MTAWEAIREAPRRLGAAAGQVRPPLRGIDSPPRRMPPLPFAVLVVVVMVAGMVGLLALTTELQNQAFAVRAAQREASELGYRVSDLESQVNRATAPAELGRRALELGMVPNPYGVFIDVRSGRVLGEPRAPEGDEIPALTTRPVLPVADPALPDAAASPAPGEPAPPPTDPAAQASAEPAPPPTDPAPAEAPASDEAAAAADPAAPAPPVEEPAVAG